MRDVSNIYLKIITEFQGMFFFSTELQSADKHTHTQKKKTKKKQHNSTKTTTCKLYLVVICVFLNWQIILIDTVNVSNE